jgi:hypothetical protein
MRRVYIEQYGYFWSLTPEKWLALCRHCAKGEGYDLDAPCWQARRLVRAPRDVCRWREEGGWSDWTATSNEVILRRPLDWDEAAFAEELRTMGVA